MKPPKKRRWRSILGTAALLLGLLAILGILGAYFASRQVPSFYVEALAAETPAQAEAGDELERRALQLRNEVQRAGQWEATFTQEQVNGWLAVDLIEKFPQLLPEEVQSPRVAISKEEVQLAFRYHSAEIDTVVSLAASVALTDEPNVIAVRIRRARAGALPIPLTQFLDQVADAVQGTDLEIRWSQVDGDPVALIRLPREHTNLPDRELRLERIQLRDGAAELGGRTESRVP